MNGKTAYKILAFQQGQTKNGKDMWRISMQSMEDEKPLTGVIWSEDIPRFKGEQFKTGNIITFLGQDYNSNYNSVVIKNVKVLKEALSGLPENLKDNYLKELVEFLKAIELKYDKHETKMSLCLLAKTMLPIITETKFAVTPAAEKYHHNYLGGLLKHTYEVWKIVKVLSNMYPIEKSEELQLAAILHDLGKTLEYEVNIRLGTATIDEVFVNHEISHIHWGFRLAHDCGAFDIARMVASHHGRVEWGALFEPETPEEKALHYADMLSASIGINTIDKLEQQVAELAAKKAEVKEEKEKEEKPNVHPTSSDIL